ncbi:hypothetical protein [Bradyrhizobium sp. AUGA SZCCT0431]|uniref:hypothetical protein n=1 Tax=Bradyrhizobium sp. AUGA SZCCT0431 TaxID=2807674 RepID=UPI001BAA5776|nr:hypothetical protein [Bradyrhizobium sp. AUGA SZCCT0431]MBR1142194.1 hypothetical protein [Bradyrhizobium sp. AUGA SZCCT0431]
MQALIHQWRQIRAALGGDLKAAQNRIGGRDHLAYAIWRFFERLRKMIAEKEKKEQGTEPCSKIVSTLLPRKFGFDLD